MLESWQKRFKVQTVPTCPHHPGAPMVLKPSAEPLFNAPNNVAREKYRRQHADERMIYRCRTKNCPRVAPVEREVERHLCKTRGCKNLADPERAIYFDYSCRECYLKIHRKRDAERAKKLMEAQA